MSLEAFNACLHLADGILHHGSVVLLNVCRLSYTEVNELLDDCVHGNLALVKRNNAAAYSAGVKTVPGVVTLPEFPVKVSGSGRIAAIKNAEDGSGTVLRIAEYQGVAGECQLLVPENVTGVEKCDMLEKRTEVLPLLKNNVMISLKPWEIVTLKLS